MPTGIAPVVETLPWLKLIVPTENPYLYTVIVIDLFGYLIHLMSLDDYCLAI